MKKLLKSWGCVLALLWSCSLLANDASGVAWVRINSLPQEAQQTLVLIKQGGPFPYKKDGAVFGNYERLLPRQTRGYYREYTVSTPRARNRGARRIVVGGVPPAPQEFYYTADHYQTFQRIQE